MSQSAVEYEAKRQWPLWALAAVSLIWFLVTLAASADLPIALPQDLDLLAERATRLIPPLIVLLLMVAFIPGRKTIELSEVEARLETATRATGELEAQLLRLDSALLACTDKVEVLRAAATSHGEGLGAAAQALEVAAGTMALSSGDLGTAANSLKEIIPGVAAQAKEAAAALGIAGSEARRHLETVETSLAQVAAHGRDAGREAEAMVSTMQGLIAQIDQSSTETTKSIANRAYTLDAAVTGVLDRSAEAFASIGETLSAQARGVEQMVTSARTELDGFGLDGTRAIGQRLDVLLSAASQLRGQFGEQQILSEKLREAASSDIGAIETRLEALRSNQAVASEALLAQVDSSARSFEARMADMAARQSEAQMRQQERLADSVGALEAH
ncbi:MAG: hypothetical protein ACRC1J_10270, partial [Sandaracinobacteroides sp.]